MHYQPSLSLSLIVFFLLIFRLPRLFPRLSCLHLLQIHTKLTLSLSFSAFLPRFPYLFFFLRHFHIQTSYRTDTARVSEFWDKYAASAACFHVRHYPRSTTVKSPWLDATMWPWSDSVHAECCSTTHSWCVQVRPCDTTAHEPALPCVQ